MTGDDHPRPWIAVFHATPSVSFHFNGSPLESAWLVPLGPRNCHHDSPAACSEQSKVMVNNRGNTQCGETTGFQRFLALRKLGSVTRFCQRNLTTTGCGRLVPGFPMSEFILHQCIIQFGRCVIDPASLISPCNRAGFYQDSMVPCGMVPCVSESIRTHLPKSSNQRSRVLPSSCNDLCASSHPSNIRRRRFINTSHNRRQIRLSQRLAPCWFSGPSASHGRHRPRTLIFLHPELCQM